MEEIRRGLRGGNEADTNVSKLSMKLAGDGEQRMLSKNAMDGLGVAGLEKLLFVLENKRVELKVA